MNKFKKLHTEEKWIVFAIPILFLLGAFFHFLYNLCGKFAPIGLIAPVNESVWEHMKMLVIPIIGCWTLYYAVKGKKDGVDKNKWFTALLVALVSSLLVIPTGFYIYTAITKTDLIIADIILFLLAVTIGQLSGLLVYRKSLRISSVDAALIIVAIIALFMLFTFCPPQIFIFEDPITGLYGMA